MCLLCQHPLRDEKAGRVQDPHVVHGFSIPEICRHGESLEGTIVKIPRGSVRIYLEVPFWLLLGEPYDSAHRQCDGHHGGDAHAESYRARCGASTRTVTISVPWYCS